MQFRPAAAQQSPSGPTPAPEPPPAATPTPLAPLPATTPTPLAPRSQGRVERFARRLQLGVRPGFGQLLSGKTRDKFGNGGLSIKPSFFKMRPPRDAESLKPDFSFNKSTHDDNRLLMISAGGEYRRFLNYMPRDPADQGTRDKNYYDKSKLEGYPYLGASLFLFGAKVRVEEDNLDTGFKLGLGSTLVAGYQYKTRWRVEAGVTGMTSVAGYNFSRFRVGMDYKL